MSAQLSRPEHIYKLVQIRAKRKGCRVKKLEGQDARDAVMNGAAWRLILNQQRFGNIREYIEGNFWHDDSEARNKLVDRALDAERQAYIRASKASGGTSAEGVWDELARYTDGIIRDPGTGLRLLPANSATDVIEQQELEAEEIAALDAREKIEADESERMRLARNDYAEQLTNIRHRRALFLICADPKASNSTIAARVSMQSIKGIKPNTVRKIRDKLTELANGIVTRSPEDLRREEQERLAAVEEAEAEVRGVERRLHRAQWLLSMSAKELAEFRAFAKPLCGMLGMSVDELFGSTIIGPKPSG